MKLLALDDEEDILAMVRGHFEPRGFEVFTASDGREGIEICKKIIPDVILLDLKLKNMDGDIAAPELRRLAPRAKIFMISAYQDEVVHHRLLGLGLDGYFEKPVSIVELEKCIKQALENK